MPEASNALENKKIQPATEASAERRRVNVFLTFDVEIWERSKMSGEAGFREDFLRHIYGRSKTGDHGLPLLQAMLREHGLHGVFLVESLFASVMGLDPLREIVDLLGEDGQEIQLHLHTEWLDRSPELLPNGSADRHIHQLSEDEQTDLIGRAIANLRACGVERPIAFRAGNYEADFNTLRALKNNGILYDTSYNYTYLSDAWSSSLEGPILQPTRIHDIYELPVSHYEDWPGHHRHAQLDACSFRELSRMLLQAWEKNWYSFVIVGHSFELLSGQRDRVDPLMRRRFERLCRFLAEHSDKFRTTGFQDLDPRSIPLDRQVAPLRSNIVRTVLRYGQQITRRILW